MGNKAEEGDFENTEEETKEVLMSDKEIEEEIRFEDLCGMNTLLQNFFYFQDKNIEVNVFMKINKKNEICGYVIRDKKTGEECQL